MILELTSATHVAANLEYPPCPLCDSGRRDFYFRLSTPYRVARCLACGVHYLHPRLIESAMQLVYRESSYYEGGESGYTDSSYLVQERALRATFKRLLHNLAKQGLTGGDFLEVGCGYGYLLDKARSFFRRRAGTDFSPEAAAIARRTGAEVFVGGVEQIPPKPRFNCVLATQVIEHVYEPLLFLERLVSRSKPGGHVVLATPDIGGVLRKLMGQRWPSFKVPEHITYFGFQTLSSLMKQVGLINVRRLLYPHACPLSLIASKFELRLPPCSDGLTFAFLLQRFLLMEKVPDG